MNKKAGFLLDILPLFVIFVVGTTMILTIGFFILKSFSEVSLITGYTVLGTSCTDNCQGINAGIMGIIVIALICFQYLFYRRYHHKRKQLLTKK